MAGAARDSGQTVGVILRDAAGAYYALPAEQLAAYRVTEAQLPAVEALVRGEDLDAVEGGAAGSGGFPVIYRNLQRARVSAEARSIHLRHDAVSLWVIGY